MSQMWISERPLVQSSVLGTAIEMGYPDLSLPKLLETILEGSIESGSGSGQSLSCG